MDIIDFKLWLNQELVQEVSDFEKAQMGKQKGKYPYVSEKEYGELRPYLVKKSQSRAAKGKMELDPSMTAYTPGETLDLLKHPRVESWFKKMESFKIPDEYGLVILVACAASKPWDFSCKRGDFYPSYNKIRQEVKSGKIKPVYFVTLSEPLGVVPQDFWGDDPANIFPQYDNPGLFKDTPMQSGMTKEGWAQSPLGSKREMPFDVQAYKESIRILGTVIGRFISNNSNHQFISFVEHADRKKISSHSEMLDVAEQVSGIKIPRNPKKPEVGRQKQDLVQYMKSRIDL